MKIAVVGLGLIGGSLAKGFSLLDEAEVLGYDKDENVCIMAKLEGVIKEKLNEKNIAECDYIFIALYPKATEDFLQKFGDKISKNTIVVDCSGTKRSVCKKSFDAAKKNGFCFIGGHPMAGTHFSGFAHSRATMFDKAGMILVPPKDIKIEILQALKELLVKIGFKSVTITSAEEHDRIIAYTSQLAHVVSNAYVKSPNAKVHKGFSAGSYKDLTRVAKLNPGMWAELFIDNKENIVFEIEKLINELQKYSDAIKNNDKEELEKLLLAGSQIKESIG